MLPSEISKKIKFEDDEEFEIAMMDAEDDEEEENTEFENDEKFDEEIGMIKMSKNKTVYYRSNWKILESEAFISNNCKF